MDKNNKLITWFGRFEGFGAYPIINRHFTRVLEDKGFTVCENMHTHENKLTPTLVSCTYPPYPANPLPHDKSVCIINWEFIGENNVPESWLPVFDTYDVVWVKSQQCYDSFKSVGIENIALGRLGVDPDEFSPIGWAVDLRRMLGLPKESLIVFWVGGTDPRHGFDIALNVLGESPDHVYLVAKQHPEYPTDIRHHDRLRIITDSIESLAPYYRGADVFLQTARAVGYSLPTAEAIACGLPVVSTDLPAIREFELDCTLRPPILYVESEVEPMNHHIHQDCTPCWWQPKDICGYVDRILGLQDVRYDQPESEVWRQNHSWEKAVDQLIPYL